MFSDIYFSNYVRGLRHALEVSLERMAQEGVTFEDAGTPKGDACGSLQIAIATAEELRGIQTLAEDLRPLMAVIEPDDRHEGGSWELKPGREGQWVITSVIHWDHDNNVGCQNEYARGTREEMLEIWSDLAESEFDIQDWPELPTKSDIEQTWFEIGTRRGRRLYWRDGLTVYFGRNNVPTYYTSLDEK